MSVAKDQGAFIWYELMSRDPAASKRFYDAVVGWDIEAASAMPNMDYRMIKRADGGNAGGVLKLSEEMIQGGSRPGWLGYLSVRDTDAAMKAMVDDGGNAPVPAWTVPGVGRMTMIADPQGAHFYILAPTPPEGQPDAVSDVFSVDRAGHVRWNELTTSDPAAAVEFYKKHFGWSQNGDMDMGEMGKYRFVQHDGVGIGAIWPKPADMPRSMWTYYFGVTDIDRAAAAVTAGGGSIQHGPAEIPGGEFALNATDPQGAVFGLVGPRNS